MGLLNKNAENPAEYCVENAREGTALAVLFSLSRQDFGNFVFSTNP